MSTGISANRMEILQIADAVAREKSIDKEIVVHEGKAAKTETCTDTEKQKVQASITAYIKSAPAPAPAAKRAEPAPTTQKK